MKKLLFTLFTLISCQSLHAADLIEVYSQALNSDPIYQQAVSQRLATKEGVPISLSSILPNINLSYSPGVTRSGFAGANVVTGSSPRNNTLRFYDLTLSLTQTVFNFSQFMTVSSSISLSSGADATLNAALQNLMIRVSSAYFAVLKDEDNLTYNEASVLAYKQQLDQVKQQFKVGIKTITDVYTAQASYDSAVADQIAAQTQLTNDKENLRVITGVYYDHLAPLSENFPLISPKPRNVEDWVKTSLKQNWQIKASQYNVVSARQIVRQQFGGHLPTATMTLSSEKQYTENNNAYRQALNQRDGPSTQSNRTIMFNLNLPIFSGGGVVAQTDQAIYNFEIAQQQLEQTQRSTVNTTRQSYFGVISGISQVKADREAVQSTISSLRGMEESYNVGAETLVNVLNQQQKVFEAQVQYASDRYAFVNNFLALKQAAGTLGFNDLRAVNVWLRDNGNYDRRRKIREYSIHTVTAVKHAPAKKIRQTAKKPQKHKHLIAEKTKKSQKMVKIRGKKSMV
ncbi:MAG TPA: TolC family outer membrane protein [Gammaproteobacteria bacterium]|jgi:outer membrane protein|nr:TolC family outer membrane protein [Gammaproteobacteria bacterium]